MNLEFIQTYFKKKVELNQRYHLAAFEGSFDFDIIQFVDSGNGIVLHMVDREIKTKREFIELMDKWKFKQVPESEH